MMVAMLLCVGSMQAVPAHPSTVKVQQPDGSYVTLQLHGDEWLSYTTTADGYTVVKDQQGYYVYARQLEGQLVATAQVAHDADARQDAERMFLAAVSKHLTPTMPAQVAAKKKNVQRRQQQTLANRHRAGSNFFSSFRGLIVLVQFNDKFFSRYDYYDIIYNMVNQQGYSGYDNYAFTGSVRDYFTDNSNGQFQPQFDIIGPVTINFTQYAANGYRNQEALINAAVDAADDYVDFSQYDGDGDGYVDMIHFIFAGNGSNYSGNDPRLLWPHRYYVIKDNWYVVKDGIRLWDYACSTELIGHTQYPQTVHLDGIGTICHEFSHVLGLPDFYDTDGADNGRSDDPDMWSVMAGGNYANDSRSPIGYSAFERWMAGFIGDPEVIRYTGDYVLQPLCQQGKFYRINSPVDKEYFIMENRQQQLFKWDEYLPGSGMLIHHVDQSNSELWEINKVNAYAQHPCYCIVRAAGAGQKNTAYDVFPGSWNITDLGNDTYPSSLRTWSGEPNACQLTGIEQQGNTITFHANVDKLPDNLGEYLSEQIGQEVVLNLVDAQVLYAYNDDVYLRDAQGSVMFTQFGFDLQRNDVLNGQLRVLVGQENGMMQALRPSGGWDVSGLTLRTGGEEVQPHDVRFENLDASYYSDYIQVRGVQIMEDSNGMWAYRGNKRARLWQKFNIEGLSIPRNLVGRYFDIEGIFGTDNINGDVIDEIYLTGNIVENTAPDLTGIEEVRSQMSDVRSSGTAYNLQGQRVRPTAKGLLIIDGKKHVQR